MNQISVAGRPAGALLGGGWAGALAITLLLALGASAVSRWSSPPQATEEIIQLPAPDAPPTPREEPTAPDPGDNP